MLLSFLKMVAFFVIIVRIKAKQFKGVPQNWIWSSLSATPQLLVILPCLLLTSILNFFRFQQPTYYFKVPWYGCIYFPLPRIFFIKWVSTHISNLRQKMAFPNELIWIVITFWSFFARHTSQGSITSFAIYFIFLEKHHFLS